MNSTCCAYKNVKQFGAKGDGITDDTVAIQTALHDVRLKGGTLYFPSGRYVITSTLDAGPSQGVRYLGCSTSSRGTKQTEDGSFPQWPSTLVWLGGTAVTDVLFKWSGGRISGSIQRIAMPGCDTFNANWTSGAITGHPNQAKLNAAGITSTAYNWGVMGTAAPATVNSGWKAGDIIGVIQNGNQLSMVNFGIDKNADTSLTFTLCPTANPC